MLTVCSPPTTPTPAPARSVTGRKLLVTLACVAAAGASLLLPAGLALPGRLALGVFALTLVAAGLTKVDELRIAAGAVAALVVVGGSSLGDVASHAWSGSLWVLVGAFVVAAAAGRAGLAERLAVRITRGAASVAGLFTRLTVLLVASAFLVPSTAGRAALMVPVFHAVASLVDGQSVRRGLAVLFPVVILLSAVASLFGAGAHLVTAEMVVGLGGERLDVVRWTVLGLPYAVASCALAQWAVLRLFVGADERRAAVDLRGWRAEPAPPDAPLVALVLAGMVALWLTEPVHGVDPALVAVGGAVLLLTCGAIGLRPAFDAVPWSLVALMVATLEVGRALARTGAADWVAGTLLAPATGSPLLVVVGVAVVSLLAHLVVSSRTARASVLVPVVVLLGGATGLDVTAVAFVSSAAAGYCLTTPSSAKPLAVFATVGPDALRAPDLRRLGIVLLPAHLVLLLVFAHGVWPALGLPLTSRPDAPVSGPGTRSLPSPTPDPMPWSRFTLPDPSLGPRLPVSPTVPAVPVPEEIPEAGVGPRMPLEPTEVQPVEVATGPDPVQLPAVDALPAGPTTGLPVTDPVPAGPSPIQPTPAVVEGPPPPPVVEPTTPAEPGADLDGHRSGEEDRDGDDDADDDG